MTTRRSRLQIRPNINRGAKETGNDAPAKKLSTLTTKCSPRKEVKENVKLNTKLEGNDVTGHAELHNKTSAECFANDKKLTPTETTNKECHDVTNVHSNVTSNEISTGAQKVIPENYSTLLNTNKECTVVLDRTLATKRHTEEVERCSTKESSEDSSTKNEIPEQLNKKKEKCEERNKLTCSQQNVHETRLKNTHSSCIGADKENKVKSKEIVLKEDNSRESAAFEDSVIVKPVAQNSVITSEKKSSNKANSSEEISKRRNRFNKKPPERGTMTMMDLIFWNPPNNPMSQEKKGDDNVSEPDASVLQAVEEEVLDNTSNLKDEELPSEDPLQNETEEVPGPRVMIGPDGDITIDEDSLVIRRKDPEKTASKEIVHDVAGCTYNSFRKARPKHYWSDSETAKFYKALSILGTDFSLMLSLFPTRNRQELKNKFKREERLHRHLVDRAIRDHQQFDLAAFEEDDDYEDNGNDEDYEVCSKNKKGTNNRKRGRRKKRAKDKGSFDDGISDDETAVVDPTTKSNESVGIRKSTRKRKETSKEIATFTSTPVVRRRQSKPRGPKPKKKAEDTVPVECEYESLEIVEVPNESLEVVSEDQSVIVCHSPLASEVVAFREKQSSDLHTNTTENIKDVEMIDTSIELKETEKQDTNYTKQLNTPLQQTNNDIPTLSNNLLQPLNCSQSNLTPGQLVLVAGKTSNTNEQVVHVYVVSQPPAQQNMPYPVGTSVIHQEKDNSTS